MPLRLLVNGAFGRMGQLTVAAIRVHPSFELVGETGHGAHLRQAILDSRADVVIDFTHPSAVFNNAMVIIEAKVHPVIGTSGLTPQQIQSLQKQCAALKLGGIIAPNFSLGAVLMMKHAKEIVKYFPHVEIIEMHHPNKQDSPSGTALHTAEMLAEHANTTLNSTTLATSTTETIPGARGASYRHIPIHAVRLPGLLAHQRIIFGNTGETLTLHHDSISRECFVPGILLACEKVSELHELVYGLEAII